MTTPKLQWLFYVMAALLVINDAITPQDYSFLTIIVASTIASIGRFVESKKKKAIQEERNKTAKELIYLAKNKNTSHFFVYLRPFSTYVPSSKLPIIDSILSPTYFAEQGYLEGYLAEMLVPSGLLIALGGPGSSYGAGKLSSSNDEWKEEISNLIDAAANVFVVPGHQPGTAWELNYLKGKGYANKIIFISPPISDDKSIEDDWKQTREFSKQQGIFIPERRRSGTFYMVNEKFDSVKREVSFGKRFFVFRLRWAISKLCPSVWAGDVRPRTRRFKDGW